MSEAEILASLFAGPGAEGTGQQHTGQQHTGQSQAAPAHPADARPRQAPALFWGLVAAGLALLAAWVPGMEAAIGQALASGWFGPEPGDLLVDGVANAIVFGGMLALATGLMVLMPVARPAPPLALPWAMVLGLALGTGGLSLALAQALAGGHAVLMPAASPSVPVLVLGAGVTAFGAVVEEVFFRGWLQTRLAARIGAPAAVLAAAVAFSALHLSGGARSLLTLVNIVLAGLFFGTVAWRTRSIVVAAMAHFAWNWAEIGLFGLSPNPGLSPYGAVLNFDLTGALAWGGGEEGLNSGIETTVALTALILPFLALREPGER